MPPIPRCCTSKHLSSLPVRPGVPTCPRVWLTAGAPLRNQKNGIEKVALPNKLAPRSPVALAFSDAAYPKIVAKPPRGPNCTSNAGRGATVHLPAALRTNPALALRPKLRRATTVLHPRALEGSEKPCKIEATDRPETSRHKT